MQTGNKLTLIDGGLANLNSIVAECFERADREIEEIFSLTRNPENSTEAEAEIIFSSLSRSQKIAALTELKRKREAMESQRLAPVLQFSL